MLRMTRVLPVVATALLSGCATSVLQFVPAQVAGNVSAPLSVAAPVARKLPAVPPLDTFEEESLLLQLALVSPRERPDALTGQASASLPDVSEVAETAQGEATLAASDAAEETSPLLPFELVAPRSAPIDLIQQAHASLPDVPIAVTPQPEATVAANDAADPGLRVAAGVAFADALPGYEPGALRELRLIDRQAPADVDVAKAEAEAMPPHVASEPLSLVAAIAELANPIPEMEPIPNDPAPNKVALTEEFKGSPRPRPGHTAQGGPEVPLVFELRR